MYCQGTACSRSFGTCVTLAEDRKLECCKRTAKTIFVSTMKILLTHYVVRSYLYFIPPMLSLCYTVISMKYEQVSLRQNIVNDIYIWQPYKL
jgi:hypothetical protein